MEEADGSEIAQNIYKDPIEISFEELTYFDDESLYRWLCPVCETGVLLMSREGTTFSLRNTDRCTYCGQAFTYLDECTEENILRVAVAKRHPALQKSSPKNNRLPRNH